VVSLSSFSYREIRAFARDALGIVAQAAPDTRHLTLTIHGPGYGLDETEAFLAELEGLLEALQAGQVPVSLERITVVDRCHGLISRMQRALDKRLTKANYASLVGASGGYLLDVLPTENLVDVIPADLEQSPPRNAGAVGRRHAFVAMPFDTHM